MKRLIEKGLMFGNLIRVDSPALIERYNRALKQLSGKTTALTEFHIDISGYSPEVGDELGDHLYLNPNGCNRQFILLSTEQKSAPLLAAKFSMSRSILREFIEANEAQLFSLTARDAVAGELEDTVYELSTPARLFDIQRMVVVADTTGNHVAEAEKLAGLIEQFRTRPDAWYDDVLIAQMIDLAKKTGDVTRNPVTLRSTAFETPDFWTAHFGGVYVFRSVAHPAAICMGDRSALGALPIAHVFGAAQRNEIAKFLELNGLVEPIVQARGGARAGAILRQEDGISFWSTAAAARGAGSAGAGSRRVVARGGAASGPRPSGGVSGAGGAAALGRGGRPLAAHRQPAPGLFLHVAGRAGPVARSGQHAAGRTQPAGCAADVHLPQGTVLSSLQDLARGEESLCGGFP